MMCWSPRCYIPSFVEIGQMVLKKKIFNIYGHCGHLGHVTIIMSFDFNYLVPNNLQNLVRKDILIFTCK